jgi:uncharacterized damage-inducible protein DinB
MDARESMLAAWDTSNRVTVFLMEKLPREVWEAAVPEVPRRTVRAIAAHIHNSRRSWIRTLRGDSGVPVPERVDRLRVSRRELMPALRRSGACMRRLLEFGFTQGGKIPAPPAYVWRNLPLDVGHVLSYFVAHEGHHRGQIVLISRQLGHPVSADISSGLWAWNRWLREARGSSERG